MDEKGFLMSYLQKVITVFPKASMQSRYSEPLVRMGSGERITLLATICADGSSLPPALI